MLVPFLKENMEANVVSYMDAVNAQLETTTGASFYSDQDAKRAKSQIWL